MSEILETIQPIYQCEKNQIISLYEGEMELVDDSQVISGVGKIEFTCFPEIKIKFSIQHNSTLIDYKKDKQVRFVVSEIDDKKIVAQARISKISFNFSPTGISLIDGYLLDSELGNGSELSYIVFHLTNFVEYKGEHVGDPSKLLAKLTIESNDWRVTIESISKEIINSLEDGGYAITHVGRLERVDSSNFTSQEAEEVLVGLNYFLSFVAGRWVSPALPVGFNSTGERVWEKWLHYRTDNYRYVTSWFPKLEPTNISVVFAGFMKWWSDEDWQESFKLLIYWYVESNYSTDIEQSIPMTQFAFELLAWIVLVQDRKKFSNKKFKDLSAEAKMRELFLNEFQIPIAMPPISETSPLFLDELKKIRNKDNSPSDSAECITAIRNRITHPRKQEGSTTILKYSRETRGEVRRLCIWYLELCLLRLFAYEGIYVNRLYKSKINYDKVPWAAKDEDADN
jgi:hypothetical protein